MNPKLTSIDEEFLEFVGKQESQYLMTKDTWRDDVKTRLGGEMGLFGDCLPWGKTHDKVRLRPGEVSIWAGINGHGKSQISGMAALWLSPHSKVLIASLEMKPAATLERMVRQASGLRQPAEKYIDSFFDKYTENVWIYDQLDTVESNRIIAMLHYAAQKLGVKHIFIDSLMKCGVGPELHQQKEFVDRLCWVAQAENIHIHLIHHMRKGEKEEHRPGKFDVRGASEVVDLADNLFIMWRNKAKENTIRKGNDPEPGTPDSVLAVAKQRHGEWEGDIMLWFDPDSQQFVPGENMGAMPWPNPEERYI